MCSVHVAVEVDHVQLDQADLAYVHGAIRTLLEALTLQGIEAFVTLRENRFVIADLQTKEES